MNSVHFVEFAGDGGIYQHVVAVADALAGVGIKTVVHTAASAEMRPGVAEFCGCFSWHRDMTWRPGRLARIVVESFARTWSHIMRVVEPGALLHLHGGQLLGGGLASFRYLHRKRVRLVFSPHNTFSRSGSRVQTRMLQTVARAADAVVVYAEPDLEIVTGWGQPEVFLVPLVMHVPRPEAELVEAWQRHFASCRPVALIPGQIRGDKGIETVIEAAAQSAKAGAPFTVALAGRAIGDSLKSAEQLATSLGVSLIAEARYIPHAEFVAAVAAADAVVCAYPHASQSAVLGVAKQVGTPTVATNVGGLAQAATLSVDPGDLGGLARAIQRAFLTSASPEPDDLAALRWSLSKPYLRPIPLGPDL